MEQKLVFPNCPRCGNMVTGPEGDYNDECECKFSGECKVDYDAEQDVFVGTPTHWVETKLAPGVVYRHFKGNEYVVLSVALDSETKHMMVVYQAMYGDRTIYVRPYKMFTSGVDHEKYPNVKQKLRFEPTGKLYLGALTLDMCKEHCRMSANCHSDGVTDNPDMWTLKVR